VQVRKADVERLAREFGGNQAAADAQEPDTRARPVASDAQAPDTRAVAPEAQKAGKLTQAVVWWLRHVSPDERPPGLRKEELGERVRKAAGERLGVFSQTTLKRAIRLAWPRAKPDQPSR
jgi:hypothetical protein